MRVTTMMRNHVRDLMMKKVQDRFDKAKKARDDQKARDEAAVGAVQEYARSLIPAMTKKVAEFAKRRGLTWTAESIGYFAKAGSANVAFNQCIDKQDFEETNTHEDNQSPKHKMREELMAEPKRIMDAVEKATDAIVFSLELGKVKKAELEELIESTEVEL